MEQLWAPWRLSYVASAKKPAAGDPCFLCAGQRERHDRQNLIVWRRSKTVAVLNRFPYNNGHLLVAPCAHKGELEQLDDDELLEGLHTMQHLVGILKEIFQPDGFNIGLNLGTAAGAGLPGHLHWHIVPRWHGDTNFMPVLADTRVIVQSLEAMYDALVERLQGAT